MGKRQMDVNMTLPKNGKKPATHLGQLKDPAGGASGGGGVSLKISVRKYCTDASVYNTEFFSSKPLYQYLLQHNGHPESKKYIFKLKDVMNLFFMQKHKDDSTAPSSWEQFQEALETNLAFVSKLHKDEDDDGHPKHLLGFYNSHPVKEFLALLDDIFAFRLSLGSGDNYDIVSCLPILVIHIDEDTLASPLVVDAVVDEMKCPFIIHTKALPKKEILLLPPPAYPARNVILETELELNKGSAEEEVNLIFPGNTQPVMLAKHGFDVKTTFTLKVIAQRRV